MTSDPSFFYQYQALTAGAGLVDFSDRTLIELAGDDRARFLHNLCTNDIRKLEPGAGCEAFLTNVQGKIVAHVLVFSGPETLVLETVSGQGEKIIAHLDRYLIREKVELRDRSTDWSEWLLAGSMSESILTALCGNVVPLDCLASAPAKINGYDAWLRRVDLAGPVGYLIDCQRDNAAAVGNALVQAGAMNVVGPAFDTSRIEIGFPFYGLDITDKNLPQEVARDARAISFTKGCYLGQETVARIDALGHVNQTLVGIRFLGEQVPPNGLELSTDAGKVGHVTSGCYSVRLTAPLALAYVRRGHNQIGTKLQSSCGEAEVVSLPVA